MAVTWSGSHRAPQTISADSAPVPLMVTATMRAATAMGWQPTARAATAMGWQPLAVGWQPTAVGWQPAVPSSTD